MKKVILNKCYGGFDVSYLAHKLYAKRKFNVDEIFFYLWSKDGYVKQETSKDTSAFMKFTLKDFGDIISHEEVRTNKVDIFRLDDSYREDEILIEIVEELGEEANTLISDLKVVEIPDEVAEDYVIDDYDGIETLHKRVEVW